VAVNLPLSFRINRGLNSWHGPRHLFKISPIHRAYFRKAEYILQPILHHGQINLDTNYIKNLSCWYYCQLRNADNFISTVNENPNPFSTYSQGMAICNTGVRFPAGAGNFSPHHRVQNGTGAHPMGTGALYVGVKRSRCETDHSPPSSA
jgi:hypothetical protein